jgi:hypothetical protein
MVGHHHTYHSSSNGARRTERPGHRQRRATAERYHQPAYRHLDRIGGRQRPRRRNRLQPALQPHWRGNMDDGHRCHQPLHAHRSERGDGNRRRSPGHQCRGKPGRVGHGDYRHDLGRNHCAGQLVCRRCAGSQHERCSERRGKLRRDSSAHSGDGGSLLLVGKPDHTSHDRPDRGDRRRPDYQRMGPVVQHASHSRHLLPLDAGAGGGRCHDRCACYLGDRGVLKHDRAEQNVSSALIVQSNKQIDPFQPARSG